MKIFAIIITLITSSVFANVSSDFTPETRQKIVCNILAYNNVKLVLGDIVTIDKNLKKYTVVKIVTTSSNYHGNITTYCLEEMR